MSSKANRSGEQFIEFLVDDVFVFIEESFCSPDWLIAIAGLKEGKKLLGEAPSPGFRSWFLEILKKSRQLGKKENCDADG